jgi:transcriptional regulator with XRE-family HTH domain
VLDTNLVVRRRHELGLSQRHVTRQLGVTSVTVAALEAGTNHDDLPLRLVQRLATTLACDLSDLLASADPAGDADPDHGSVSQVGSLLAGADEPVDVDTLAEALECTLAETRVRLDALDGELRPCGLRVGEQAGRVSIVADTARRSPAPFERLLRGQHARRGMAATEATLLYRAMNGALQPGKLTNAEQVAYARLLNAGLLDSDDGPSRAVREAFA